MLALSNQSGECGVLFLSLRFLPTILAAPWELRLAGRKHGRWRERMARRVPRRAVRGQAIASELFRCSDFRDDKTRRSIRAYKMLRSPSVQSATFGVLTTVHHEKISQLPPIVDFFHSPSKWYAYPHHSHSRSYFHSRGLNPSSPKFWSLQPLLMAMDGLMKILATSRALIPV